MNLVFDTRWKLKLLKDLFFIWNLRKLFAEAHYKLPIWLATLQQMISFTVINVCERNKLFVYLYPIEHRMNFSTNLYIMLRWELVKKNVLLATTPEVLILKDANAIFEVLMNVFIISGYRIVLCQVKIKCNINVLKKSVSGRLQKFRQCSHDCYNIWHTERSAKIFTWDLSPGKGDNRRSLQSEDGQRDMYCGFRRSALGTVRILK